MIALAVALSGCPMPTGEGGKDDAAPITIATSDGRARLTVPPAALPEGVTPEDIEIRDVTDDPEFFVESDPDPALAVVLLEPLGLEFSQPVTLTVRQLPVEDPIRQLFVLHIFGDDAELITDVESEIDPETNTLTASIPLTHFSVVLVTYVQDLVKAEITPSASNVLVGETFDVTVKATRTVAPGKLIKKFTFTESTILVQANDMESFFMSDGPWTLTGVANGIFVVKPRRIDDVPPLTSVTGPTFTTKLMFECTSRSIFGGVEYSASAHFELRQVFDSVEFGMSERDPESKFDADSEIASIVCVHPKIVASAAPPFTTYTLSPRIPGGYRFFSWSGANCGSITGSTTSTMVWNHGEEDCDHTTTEHLDATISLLVTGKFPISGESFELRCTYLGAASGEGPECFRVE